MSQTTIDPALSELRGRLRPFRRRLWLRRVVRDGTVILGVALAAQLVLAIVARVVPFEWHLLVAAMIIAVSVAALLIDVVRVRPTLAETALALDAEQDEHAGEERVVAAGGALATTP